MFEKEAGEYTKKNFCGCCPLTWKNQCENFVNCGYHDSWKDGAEFGYNKANEMHDLRKDPNDLPKGQINRFLFAYVKNYGGKKPMLVCYNGEWFYNAYTYNDEVKVIQWCEIPQFKG